MSFEMYLSCFEDGQEGYFRTDVIDEAFAPSIISRGPEHSLWTIAFDSSPENPDQTDLHLNLDPEDSSQCSGFTVDRPSGNLLLFDSLMKILRTTNSAVYWPGECPPLVGRQETIPHMDPDMVETLGTPVVISGGDEIRAWLNRS